MKDVANVKVEMRHIYSPESRSDHPNNTPWKTLTLTTKQEWRNEVAPPSYINSKQ
jgi:hypothetical protein